MKNSTKQNKFVNKAGAAWSDVQKAAIVAVFAFAPASAWAQDAIGEFVGGRASHERPVARIGGS